MSSEASAVMKIDNDGFWRKYSGGKMGKKIETSSKAVNFSDRPLFLVRGNDQCGLNDFEIGHNAS